MASLITANSGASDAMSLSGIGFIHGREFVVYAEVVEHRDLDADEFDAGALVECEAQRLDGARKGWWNGVGTRVLPGFSNRQRDHFQVVWPAALDVGSWRVVLRINGRAIAEREIAVLEFFQ